MPQWRKLHVKSVQSDDINEMPSDFARLLWVMLPLGLDAEGRGIYNPSWVKSKIFPIREDVTNDMVQEGLNWFCERGMIGRYEVAGRFYFYIPTWHDYQGSTEREAESILPPPPDSGVNQEQVKSKSCTDVDTDVDVDVDTDTTTAAKGAAGAKSRKKSARQEAISALENEFSSITDIPLPGRATDRQKMSASVGWWQPLAQIWELENKDTTQSLALIHAAVAKMRKDSLTIAAPRSIVKVAISLHSNGRGMNHAPSHNGNNDPNYADLEYLRLNPKGKGRADAIERLKARGYDVAAIPA